MLSKAQPVGCRLGATPYQERFVEKPKTVLLSLFGFVLISRPAWAWFNEGHEIVAVIAADDLTPTARWHVAQILGVPDDTGSVEKAMAAASIRPDTEFRSLYSISCSARSRSISRR